MSELTAPPSQTDLLGNAGRKLTMRYLLALLIVAVLVSCGHFVMARALTEANSDSRVINLAGRQRMLSQRMVKTLAEMSLVQPARSSETLRASLRSDLESWTETHHGLQSGNETLGLPPASDPEIAALLAGLDDRVFALAALLRAAEQNAEPPSEALMREAHALSHDFVTEMDRLVFAWDEVSTLKLDRLKQLAQAIWILALLTLVAEALLIFRPFVKQLAHSHRALQTRSIELERLAMVARCTTNAVIITDEKRNILWVNEGFTRITGHRPEEVIGRTPAMLQAQETDPGAIELMHTCLTAGEGCRLEILNRRKDGKQIWMDLDIQPLHDDAGRLTGFISIQSDITERRQLQYHASTDELTGLPNRRRFFERLQEEHLRTGRTHHAGALLILDIDHFKQVNDNHGHIAGDHVLRTLADVIRTTIRQTDFPGRIGGEEFGIILPETTPVAATQLAERLRTQIATQITHVANAEFSVTVSVGISLLTPDYEIADIFNQADQALYQAKGAGRNRVVITDPADS